MNAYHTSMHKNEINELPISSHSHARTHTDRLTDKKARTTARKVTSCESFQVQAACTSGSPPDTTTNSHMFAVTLTFNSQLLICPILD